MEREQDTRTSVKEAEVKEQDMERRVIAIIGSRTQRFACAARCTTLTPGIAGGASRLTLRWTTRSAGQGMN